MGDVWLATTNICTMLIVVHVPFETLLQLSSVRLCYGLVLEAESMQYVGFFANLFEH